MNGKPVLVEKPVTVNRIEFQRAVDLSEEKNFFVMEAMWTRFLPVFRQIKTWLNTKEIGDPELVISAFGFKAPRNLEDRWLNPQLAGGAVLDLSVYNVAATQMVFGKVPKVVKAEAVIGPTGVDEMINATWKMRIILNVLLKHVLAQLGVDASAVLLLNLSLNNVEYANGRVF
jgi:predicted dehydrogenase